LDGIPAKVRYGSKNTPFEKNNQPLISGNWKEHVGANGNEDGTSLGGRKRIEEVGEGDWLDPLKKKPSRLPGSVRK